MYCFSCHVGLCLLEPTGNLQIMETQFHNSPILSWANTTANLHALFKGLQRGRSNRDTWKKIVQSQRFLKKDSPVFFAYGPCNNIHQFEGCFLLGQVSLNGFKNFNGCIVEYLSFISLSTKTLENILF